MPLAQSLWIHSGSLRRQQALTKADRAKGVLVTYLIFLMVIALACSLFYIWSRIQIINVGYEINRELALKEQLIEEGKHLALEVATLKSPVRLESLAKNEYQMDLPQKSQILNQTEAKIFEVTSSVIPPATPGSAKKNATLSSKGEASKSEDGKTMVPKSKAKASVMPLVKNEKNQKMPGLKNTPIKKSDPHPPKLATVAAVPSLR